MENDALDRRMRELISKNEFLLESPKEGHQLRFMNKLNAQSQKKKTVKVNWKSLSIAASFLILIGIGFTMYPNPQAETDLASVSPEMAQTQNFFTSTIQAELANLEKEESPHTRGIVDDALVQMDNLENEYEKLKKDLAKSGNDKRVIHAMISNFQNRITLLENVLLQIEEIKTLKTNINENII